MQESFVQLIDLFLGVSFPDEDTTVTSAWEWSLEAGDYSTL